MRFSLPAGLIILFLVSPSGAEPLSPLPKADGYRGIWYMNQPSKDEYHYKYSGGLGTYCQWHIPMAIYSPEANKTFFCYGGTVEGKQELLHMVSYYDHATGLVPRPSILLNKQTDDAHDNPVISLDKNGHVWIFSSAHGTSRPSYIHRSKKPFEIDEFEQTRETNFSYPQPWYFPGFGFVFLHTLYSKGRGLHWMTSPDGLEWSQTKPLAKIEMGDYQISATLGDRVATAFDMHPSPVGLNERTNIYYLETGDFGTTWQTVDGKPVETPVAEARNVALVHDYKAEGLLVYLKDLTFDAMGRPVILYLTSRGYASGPASGPRTWMTAHWKGTAWEFLPMTTSDHNYDHGSLYIESDGTWRVIAPTEPGPQPYGTGGEMVMWTSSDEGKTWNQVRQLTRNSPRNHTYARHPVNAHPDFYSLWADGDAFQPSESSLYFTNRTGEHVWRLPARMEVEMARPEVAW